MQTSQPMAEDSVQGPVADELDGMVVAQNPLYGDDLHIEQHEQLNKSVAPDFAAEVGVYGACV